MVPQLQNHLLHLSHAFFCLELVLVCLFEFILQMLLTFVLMRHQLLEEAIFVGDLVVFGLKLRQIVREFGVFSLERMNLPRTMIFKFFFLCWIICSTAFDIGTSCDAVNV